MEYYLKADNIAGGSETRPPRLDRRRRFQRTGEYLIVAESGPHSMILARKAKRAKRSTG